MKEAYYFSHDSNAKDDPKCVLLIEQLGLEGYGIFWVLIETLREQPNYKYPLALLPALARRFNTTVEKMKAVVFNYQLFEITHDEFFYSDSLNRRMEIMIEKSQKRITKAKKAAAARWKKTIDGNVNANAMLEHSTSNASAMLNDANEKKVNESKRNEIKVNENKYYDKHDKNDKLNIFTKLLIDNKIINKEDLKIYEYDLFLDSLFKEYSKNELLIVINYVIKRMKENGEIENKLGYFITAVKDGLKQINRPGFDYDEWEQSMQEIAVRMNEEGRF